MFNDEYKNSRSNCGFVGSVQKMSSVTIVEPKLQLRSIQKTVLDDQYGLPHQVSCGAFLPVPFDNNLPDLGDSDVAIIGSQQNLSRSCTVRNSTRELSLLFIGIHIFCRSSLEEIATTEDQSNQFNQSTLTQ